MSQPKKFHATPSMLRNLYSTFAPKSENVHFDYEDLQFKFMKFTVIERIVDSLIQKIRNKYVSTIINNDTDFLTELDEIQNLNTYYEQSDHPSVKKILEFLNDIAEKRDDFLTNKKSISFLIYIQNVFNNSCQALDKSLNDRIEFGLYYHDDFTFLGKLFDGIKQQLKQAEVLRNELKQIIQINDPSYQNDEEESPDEEDNDDQQSLVEKFISKFKEELCSFILQEEDQDES